VWARVCVLYRVRMTASMGFGSWEPGLCVLYWQFGGLCSQFALAARAPWIRYASEALGAVGLEAAGTHRVCSVQCSLCVLFLGGLGSERRVCRGGGGRAGPMAMCLTSTGGALRAVSGTRFIGGRRAHVAFVGKGGPLR
jgi:hypothetical protein